MTADQNAALAAALVLVGVGGFLFSRAAWFRDRMTRWYGETWLKDTPLARFYVALLRKRGAATALRTFGALALAIGVAGVATTLAGTR